nr:hypothetical protein [Tanacetum cinerariifolium]
RKGKGDRGSRGDNRHDYNRRKNQRRVNDGAMANAAPNDNEVCPKCKNKKHDGGCWKCGSSKERLPKFKKNGQGGNNRAVVYKLRVMDAQQDPKVVTEPELVKVEQYILGLSKKIRGDVTSSRPAGIDEAVRIAYQLMGQIIQDKTDEVFEGKKRKGKGDRGSRGDNRHDYNRRKNQRRV